MAELVLGMGTAHTVHLSTPPDKWHLRGETDKLVSMLYRVPDGKNVTYEELLAAAPPELAEKQTLEIYTEQHERNQKAIASLAQTLETTNPDVLIIVGNDQKVMFQEDNMPILSVFWGDTIHYEPHYINPTQQAVESVDARVESHRVSAWGNPTEPVDYPGCPELGLHIIKSLLNQKVDVSHSRFQKEGQSIDQAFSFIYKRIQNEKPIPTVPFIQNTYYPPIQPSPGRSYEYGRALRNAIDSWDSDLRVAVIASGGISSYVIDEELDRMFLDSMLNHDAQAIADLPVHRMNAGTSEMRNWLVAAGVFEDWPMHLIDYVACYRSPAGTGCSMAFATWQ